MVETCAVRGLLMKSTGPSQDCEYSHVPVSVFPTPYPWEHFAQAVGLQEPMATMVASLVRQPACIHDILKYF